MACTAAARGSSPGLLPRLLDRKVIAIRMVLWKCVDDIWQGQAGTVDSASRKHFNQQVVSNQKRVLHGSGGNGNRSAKKRKEKYQVAPMRSRKKRFLALLRIGQALFRRRKQDGCDQTEHNREYQSRHGFAGVTPPK
jgi:hypothetical protein